ncbi:TPA: fibronectin binding protein [Streptococcus pyogenes]|nr:fibronectin binding protein [Streptococcus pyogenes]
MTNCKYKLRKLSVGLVSVGTMLIAPTVLGQEVSTGTANTETSASSTNSNNTASADATASGTAASGASSEATVATAPTTNGGSQSTPAAAETTLQPQAQTAVAASATTTASSSSETQTSKSANTTTSSTPAAASSNGNQLTGTEAETPMMEVEHYTVDKKDSSVTQTDDKKLLKIRRDGKEKEDRTLYDVKREVKDNGDGTLDVTLKVMPKQIDEGADVMALLDVSKKMTDADFNNAKEKIKKLVKTLTSKPTDNQPNHNARNSVRLMTFYRKVNDPIELNEDNVDAKLNEVWEQAKKDWDWGVDLQGAIHKARDIFKNEKNSKKRQHIVLFSQGESTFSYDINDKDKTKLKTITEDKITTSNPLFPWLPIFNHTNQKADMLDDIAKVIKKVKDLGVKSVGTADSVLSTLKMLNGLNFLTGSMTEYITLKEYDSDKLEEKYFDYTKRVGEGYYYHSFSNRKSETQMPFESELKAALQTVLPQFKDSWFTQILERLGLSNQAEQAKVDIIMKILNTLFYRRQYHYYNHNLSAIAEAKMAQKEGITFYSVDVTSPNQPATTKRSRRSTEKKEAEERNEKFDRYLKEMSEGQNFLNDTDVKNQDKFKDTLTELKIKDEFSDKVTVEENSWNKPVAAELKNSNKNSIKHQKASSSSSSWFLSSTKESLTWTISKEQLKKAFEDGKPLTLTYKLKVGNAKFKTALLDDKKNKRKKRDTSTENENSVTEKIISNITTYKINGQEVKGNNLDDIKLTYTKETVPVPDVEGEVVPIPEKPLVEPMTPLYPAIPNYPTPQLPKDEDLEISGGHGPIVDIVEDTGTGVEGGAQNGVVSTQENKDPIVDITEDTQPGMSGSNDATVVEEDTVPKRPDILVGGQSDPIDITEDTQPGMSGSNDATVIEEDTKPKRFFHFDNEPQAPEKPKEQPSLSLPQAPVYKAAHHLPASGDKREASFTIVALTFIGAAGLLSKKRRDTEEN